jgi:hypothetical protein
MRDIVANRIKNSRTKIMSRLQEYFWAGIIFAGLLTSFGRVFWGKDNYLLDAILILVGIVILFFAGRSMSEYAKDDIFPLIDRETKREKKLASLESRLWLHQAQILPLL